MLVVDQTPSAGSTLQNDSIICLYTEENSVRVSVNVPDLTNMTLQQAQETLKSKNLNISYEGTGTVESQDIKKDTSVEEGTIIKVKLSN